MGTFTLAICQHEVRASKDENLNAAGQEIKKAAEQGADIVVLPEMFVCEFVPDIMKANAEQLDGRTMDFLSAEAGRNGLWLVGGSFPQFDGTSGMYFNTCPVFAPDGSLKALYKKTHLFDVSIKSANVKSVESDLFTPGDELVVVDTGFVKMGIALCYDVRFPYIFSQLAENGAQLAVVPAAFAKKTGEAHWELALRSRAVDSQMYVAGAGAACGADASFITYGNSRIVNPWGEIISAAGDGEEIICADIDLEQLDRIRSELPLLKQSRMGQLKMGKSDSRR